MQAAEVKIYLARLPMLLGRTEIAKIVMTQGDFQFEFPAFPQYQMIHVQNANLELGALAAKSPIKFKVDGGINDTGQAISAEGYFSLDSLEEWSWEASEFDTKIKINEITLGGLKEIFKQVFGINVLEGVWSGTWQLNKQASTSTFNMGAQMDIKGLIYQIDAEGQDSVSPKMDVRAEYELSWDTEKDVLNVQSMAVTFPVGQIRLEGMIDWQMKEVKDLRVTASNIVMESIPQYFTGLKKAIPFNIGFSGQSDIEMSLSGTWDNLALHVNWDLTHSLLTYARYFSKPKTYPMNLTFDYLLKDRSLLSGDFSVRINDVTMKGTLTDLDLASGEGQINILTNKFQLNGWEKLIPPIQNLKIEGQAKLLANFEGNLQKIYDTKTTFNITVEEGKMTSTKGTSISGINLALDLSPLAFDLRKATFNIDDSAVAARVLIYGLKESPSVELSLDSQSMNAARVFTVVDDFASEWLTPAESKIKEDFIDHVIYLFPEGQFLSNVAMNAEFKNHRWTLANLVFSAYQGDISLQGIWDLSGWPGTYHMTGNLEKISLSRFHTRADQEAKPPVEGNLFLKVDVEGQAGDAWLDSMRGTGAMLMTNGAFRTVNLFSTIGKIAEFEAIAGLSGGGTPFHDIHSPLEIENRKVTMQDLAILLDKARIQANGEVSFRGVLNYRLEVFLSPALFPKGAEALPTGSEDFLGPIPLLLSGPFDSPELKPDLPQVPNFLSHLINRKPEKALDAFLSEDFFLEQWKKS